MGRKPGYSYLMVSSRCPSPRNRRNMVRRSLQYNVPRPESRPNSELTSSLTTNTESPHVWQDPRKAT